MRVATLLLAAACVEPVAPCHLVDRYRDTDRDGWGDAYDVFAACETPRGYVDAAGDCDDGNSLVNPGREEVCNGLDDDCDQEVDDGLVVLLYVDGDADGYGRDDTATLTCERVVSSVEVGGDCDDLRPAVSPAAAEVCDNGVDDDCDDEVDERRECAVDTGL